MTNMADKWIDAGLHNILIPFICFGLLMLAARRFKNLTDFSRDRAQNAVRNLILMFGNGGLYGLFFLGIEKAFGDASRSVIPYVNENMWAGWPFIATVIVGLLALDFANYWNHRLMHTKFVWGVHAIHHSDRHMTWTTSYRVHVLQSFVMMLGFAFIVLPLNLPGEALAMAGFINGVHNKYAHCQLEWTHGPLRKWIVSPNYHRWHHADTPEAYDKNIADMFVFWDRMFGTYYDPGICRERIGLPDGPDTLPEVMIYPFKYWLETYGPKKKTKPAEAVPSA